MVIDGVEAVGVVTVGAAVGPPGLRLLVSVGVIIRLQLLRWLVRIGKLVVGVQEGFAVSAGNGIDGGVQTGSGGGRGGGGVALTGG